MTPVDQKTCEQLCAWMDGELPADEVRFLERRLQHDVELREKWERLQIASACLKGQPLQPMRRDFSEAVMAAISVPEMATRTRRPLWAWGIAASVAALAVLVGVQTRPVVTPTAPNTVTQAAEVSMPSITASPAEADLVATNASAAAPVVAVPDNIVKRADTVRPVVRVASTDTVALQSPMPLDSQSPTDFPLAETSAARSWPRSPLASGDDPSMEAYLVRHNEMVSDGGLGGFVPYVDVVTRERDGADDAGDTQAGEDGKQ